MHLYFLQLISELSHKTESETSALYTRYSLLQIPTYQTEPLHVLHPSLIAHYLLPSKYEIRVMKVE